MSPSISKQNGRIDSMMLLSALGLVLALAAFAYNLWQMSLGADWDEQYRGMALEMRNTTQDIRVSSREAFSGNEEAFTALSRSAAQFPQQLEELRSGREGLPAPGPSMSEHIGEIQGEWTVVSGSAGAILSARDRILFIRDVSANLNSNIRTIQAHYADLVDILGDTNVSNETLLAAQQQLWLIERIGRNIDRILEGGANAPAAAEEFKRDAQMFQRNM